MSKEIENKIAQLHYEISLLGLDQESLTGVTIRADELKDLVKNLSLSGVSKSVNCDLCGNTGYLISENGELGEDCYKCDK